MCSIVHTTFLLSSVCGNRKQIFHIIYSPAPPYPRFSIGKPFSFCCINILYSLGGTSSLAIIDSESDGSPRGDRTFVLWNPPQTAINSRSTLLSNNTAKGSKTGHPYVNVQMEISSSSSSNSCNNITNIVDEVAIQSGVIVQSEECSISSFLNGCEDKPLTLSGPSMTVSNNHMNSLSSIVEVNPDTKVYYAGGWRRRKTSSFLQGEESGINDKEGSTGEEDPSDGFKGEETSIDENKGT